MMSVNILLDTIDKIRQFINDINRFEVDFTLVSGRYTIHSKEVTFIFCMNLYEPIELNIQLHGENPDVVSRMLEPYIAK